MSVNRADASNSNPLLRAPRLQRELLFGFGLLTAAAVSLAVLSALVAQVVPPSLAAAVLVLLVVADVGVVFVFARHLIHKFVLMPLSELDEATREVAAGDLDVQVPIPESREFAELAFRFNEMTARLQETQDQLLRAEKLASIGRLAAGIAHEIGNPLAAIGNYVALIEKRGAEPESLETIRSELRRIDRIVRDLLAYARTESGTKQRINLTVLTSGVLERLRQQGAVDGVELRFREPEEDLSVIGQHHQLEQVFTNLILNAAHAAAHGVVQIELETGVPRAPQLLASSSGILVRIGDSGPGVPVEHRERVFDPFFTTKDPGSGTGLGLAIVHRFVHEHGGLIWVGESKLGGALFNIFFPRAT